MKLFEIQSAGIDQELNQTAQQIGNTNNPPAKAGGFSPGPGQQADPNQPTMPNGAGPTDTEQDQENLKAVDSAILNAVNDMPYVKKYDHAETSKINPYSILQMDLSALNQLKNIAEIKIGRASFDGARQMGDPGQEFYDDLLSFTERVIDLKRQGKQELDKSSNSRTK